ncbi:transcriptional regulator FtrA [Zavarzinia sp. CC-PAN008]|uniref:transcriptional regulator FtrA n=1 Tax=Zavarzinia sp. CC-PAN008 TaxID=3243332 RepID=UPI003F746174
MPKAMRDARLVAALVYDGLCTFEFGIVAEVFGLERPEMGADWYRFVPVAEVPGPVRAGGGIQVVARHGLDVLARAGTIVVPGWGIDRPPASPALAQALRAAHAEGARLVTICSGAFLPAELGLLDGRRATTHWRYAARLTERFPAVRVDPGVLYIDEGDVLTSAGSAAGIDLLLHVVRKDFGAAAANSVARRLVVPPHRAGGQQQFIDQPVPRVREGRLAPLLDAVRARPAEDWSIARMAALAGFSARTFVRRFRALTGAAPGDWLIATRVDVARHALETSGAALADIAEACGLGSVENLSRQFRRRVGVPPGEYRRAFKASLV